MEDNIARLDIKKIVGRAHIENTASIRIFAKIKLEFVEDLVEDEENRVPYPIEK